MFLSVIYSSDEIISSSSLFEVNTDDFIAEYKIMNRPALSMMFDLKINNDNNKKYGSFAVGVIKPNNSLLDKHPNGIYELTVYDSSEEEKKPNIQPDYAIRPTYLEYGKNTVFFTQVQMALFVSTNVGLRLKKPFAEYSFNIRLNPIERLIPFKEGFYKENPELKLFFYRANGGSLDLPVMPNEFIYDYRVINGFELSKRLDLKNTASEKDVYIIGTVNYNKNIKNSLGTPGIEIDIQCVEEKELFVKHVYIDVVYYDTEKIFFAYLGEYEGDISTLSFEISPTVVFRY